MSQLGEMSNDEFDAFFVVDTDSCIESFAGGIDADNRNFCGSETFDLVGLMPNEETNTASALLRTGSSSKNASRASDPSMVDDQIVPGVTQNIVKSGNDFGGEPFDDAAATNNAMR